MWTKPRLLFKSCRGVAGHQIVDVRRTGNQFAAWKQPKYRVGPVARMAICPSRHKLGGDNKPAQAAPRKIGGKFFTSNARTCPQTGRARCDAEIPLAAPRSFADRKRADPRQPALYGEASDRHTLCVSTQVGCAYGCKFCASGLDGWKRNLTPDEIVEQVLAVERWHVTEVPSVQSQVFRRTKQPDRKLKTKTGNSSY